MKILKVEYNNMFIGYYSCGHCKNVRFLQKKKVT